MTSHVPQNFLFLFPCFLAKSVSSHGKIYSVPLRPLTLLLAVTIYIHVLTTAWNNNDMKVNFLFSKSVF